MNRPKRVCRNIPSNERPRRDGERVVLEGNDLFSCPWCAGRSFESRYTAFEGRTTGCSIVCAACGTWGPYHETEAEAKAGWNRRDWNAPEQSVGTTNEHR